MQKTDLVIGGHFGHGFRVFQSGFHSTLQYGFIHQDGTMDVQQEIKDIGKEGLIELATMLLVAAKEL